MFKAFPPNLTSIQNPHRIPVSPWGLITFPIPIPYPYPWEIGNPNTHGLRSLYATKTTKDSFVEQPGWTYLSCSFMVAVSSMVVGVGCGLGTGWGNLGLKPMYFGIGLALRHIHTYIGWSNCKLCPNEAQRCALLLIFNSQCRAYSKSILIMHGSVASTENFPTCAPFIVIVPKNIMTFLAPKLDDLFLVINLFNSLLFN